MPTPTFDTPISTYNTQLEISKATGSSTTFTAFYVPIKDFPDMGSDPETIDVTTLYDDQFKYIAGIKGSGALSFNANYDKSIFTKIEARNAAGEAVACTLTLQDGSTLKWDGFISGRITGKGVNEGVEMSVTIVPSSGITFTGYTAPSSNG